MVKKVGEEFKEFILGQNVPADVAKNKKAVTFGKKISVKDASKAVGGNAVQNFFARLQLFIKNKEWFKNKNIQKRLGTHDQTALIKLNQLFNRAYPDNSKVEDKRVLKFMNKFVRPNIVVGDKFAGMLHDNDRLLVLNLKPYDVVKGNVLRLYEVGITGKDLFEHYKVNPDTPESEALLKKLSSDKETNEILKDFGLTPEFFAKLEKFSPEPDVQLALFKAMPPEKHAALNELIASGLTATDFLRVAGQNYKNPSSEDTMKFLSKVIETTSKAENFTLKALLFNMKIRSVLPDEKIKQSAVFFPAGNLSSIPVAEVGKFLNDSSPELLERLSLYIAKDPGNNYEALDTFLQANPQCGATPYEAFTTHFEEYKKVLETS